MQKHIKKSTKIAKNLVLLGLLHRPTSAQADALSVAAAAAAEPSKLGAPPQDQTTTTASPNPCRPPRSTRHWSTTSSSLFLQCEETSSRTTTWSRKPHWSHPGGHGRAHGAPRHGRATRHGAHGRQRFHARTMHHPSWVVRMLIATFVFLIPLISIRSKQTFLCYAFDIGSLIARCQYRDIKSNVIYMEGTP